METHRITRQSDYIKKIENQIKTRPEAKAKKRAKHLIQTPSTKTPIYTRVLPSFTKPSLPDSVLLLPNKTLYFYFFFFSFRFSQSIRQLESSLSFCTLFWLR